MITYQDFFADYTDISSAITDVINQWKADPFYTTAVIADEYDRQMNTTVMNYVKIMYSMSGAPIEDFTASNNKITSNFFARLNTQRCTYSLGNGITFAEEGIKDRFGSKFDNTINTAGYYALIHGLSFVYLGENTYDFKVTEFAPLWDEETGALRAGVRFWQLAPDKPQFAVFYEEDGFTKYRKDNAEAIFKVVQEKRGYIQRYQKTPALGEEIIGEDNYSGLPIVPMWGSRLKQSTLIGMRQKIDSFDLIRSGFANDLTDLAQVFWILENYGGMDVDDIARFRDNLKLHHFAEMDTAQGGGIKPYAQEIPYQARKVYLDDLRAGIYEDFGGLDVHTISAGATNDHIDAAYQPMDENADDFEYQIIECIQQLGVLLGIDADTATPLFKRNRISNQKEQVEMLVQEAEWLDEETILNKLPNISPDEVVDIMRRKSAEEVDRMSRNPFLNQSQEDGEE